MHIAPEPLSSPAVVLASPGHLGLQRLDLEPPGPADVLVEVHASGISTGTERLLWNGRMPQFPGMGYPLVPGYESVGTVIHAGPDSKRQEGDLVFVPGARCYGPVRGLFGGASRRVVLPGARTVPVAPQLRDDGVLLALAATAYHACSTPTTRQPDLIVGHGVLGRLLARLAVAAGARPTVWETNAARQAGGAGYDVVHPKDDPRFDYHCICDVSGDATLLDTLVLRLAPGGEVVLAGFYEQALSFTFPAAFQREARFRIAAQWQPTDLVAVSALASTGQLSLDGLITHRMDASNADTAYRTAFGDADCLKMVLDWRNVQ